MGTRTFRSKVDWWLVVFFVAVMSWTIVAVSLDPEGGTWAILIVLATDAMLAWVLLSIQYRLGESELTVTFGPLRFRYPLQEISLVRKGGWWAQVSSFREPRLRLALSRDNLIVESRQDGRPRRVVISPRDTREFLRLVKERAPQAEIRGFERPF